MRLYCAQIYKKIQSAVIYNNKKEKNTKHSYLDWVFVYTHQGRPILIGVGDIKGPMHCIFQNYLYYEERWPGVITADFIPVSRKVLRPLPGKDGELE